jgi:putative tryptophan/tyrosine transport system substrate-binding protein
VVLIGAQMRRRKFITLLGGAVAAWPVKAGGQPARRLPRIGYLSDEKAVPNLLSSHDVVLDRLRERGYVDGRNVVIEYRYVAGKVEQLKSAAAELVALPVEVIVAIGTPAARAAIAATKTIPIVFARIGDPVGYGLVTSLARPGGNATGVGVFTAELAEKRVDLLKQAAPGLTRIAVLHQLNFEAGDAELVQLEAVTAPQNVDVHAVGVSNIAGLEHVMEDIVKGPPGALFVGSSAMFEANPQRLVDLGLKTHLLTLYVRREYVEMGGTMSYGPSFRDMYRTAADDVARILNGASPADLPVQLPTKIELVINLKTAKMIGFTFPPLLLVGADEVIE